MKRVLVPSVVSLAALVLSLPAHAAPAKVVFSKQVLPLFARECFSCHRGAAAPGGYSMESPEKIAAGGRHGAAVLPGKSAESTLIRYLTGQLKPQMPPGRSLPLDTVAVVRRWIDEGGRIDSMALPSERGGIMRDAMPMRSATGIPGKEAHGHPTGSLLPAAVVQSAPVTSLAYSPDGKLVAAGGYRAVRLLDPGTGEIVRSLSGPFDQVLSVAWSPDGRWLAAGGGLSGAFGEVCVWDTSTWSRPRVLKDHTDTIVALAWRAGGAELATASLDKTAKVWDVAGGAVKKTLKDHVDQVLGVTYSPDGRWLATGSADRTVKLYDAGTLARVNSYTNPDPVSSVAFSGGSDLLAVVSDKQLRVWPVKTGAVENPLRGHGEGEAINAIAFSKDGTGFLWGASNRKVRLWNGDVSSQRRELDGPQDWVYSVALSPDGKVATAGTADGKLFWWNTADGKLIRTEPLGAAATVANAADGGKK